MKIDNGWRALGRGGLWSLYLMAHENCQESGVVSGLDIMFLGDANVQPGLRPSIVDAQQMVAVLSSFPPHKPAVEC